MSPPVEMVCEKGEGSKMEVVYEYLCTLVAVLTCWEQSAPFDRGRWKLPGLGSPRSSMLIGVCRCYRRAHMRERRLGVDLGGYI